MLVMGISRGRGNASHTQTNRGYFEREFFCIAFAYQNAMFGMQVTVHSRKQFSRRTEEKKEAQVERNCERVGACREWILERTDPGDGLQRHKQSQK